MNETIPERVQILVVEDNPGDVDLMKTALKRSKILIDLHVVQDGVEATSFLFRTGKYANVPTPDVIFLDLNLPRKNGQEVLAEIKTDSELKKIPVVVLTSSTADEDILRSYNLHANCFVSKPVDFDQFMKVVGSIENFWLSVVKLPM